MVLTYDTYAPLNQFIDFDQGNCMDGPGTISNTFNPDYASTYANTAFAIDPPSIADNYYYGLKPSYDLKSIHAHPELIGPHPSQMMSGLPLVEQVVSMHSLLTKAGCAPEAEFEPDTPQSTDLPYLSCEQPGTTEGDASTGSSIGTGSSTADDERGRDSQDASLQHGKPRNQARRQRKKKERDQNSPSELEKRARFLERNRIAASKCRQKKKEWATNLDEQARELKASKEILSSQKDSLKQEVLYLKLEMLRHAGCNCPVIKSYLKKQTGELAGVTKPCEHCKGAQDHTKSSPISLESHRTSATSMLSPATTATIDQDEVGKGISNSDAEENDLAIHSPTDNIASTWTSFG